MATWTKQSKNTANWTGQSKNTASWVNIAPLLLKENRDLLLLETGSAIILESETDTSPTWSNITKS